MSVAIDETEFRRRQMLQEINAPLRGKTDAEVRAELEAAHGKVYTTSELNEDFDVVGFMAPVVVVIRKSDHQKGSMEFTHMPRFYYGFQPYHGR